MAKRGQNEGSIFQRKDGRWVAIVNQGWQNGKRVRKSYYGETRKEELERHTRELRMRGVSTSTFGVGSDFNQFLLEGVPFVVIRVGEKSTAKRNEVMNVRY